MRRIALIALVAAACSTGPTPVPAPTPLPTVSPVGSQSSEAAAPQLPAAEPAPPTLREFRARAEGACQAAARTVAMAPLLGDPFTERATAADRRAAAANYQARAAAWAAAAEDLWTYGVPTNKAGQALVTALDTVAQYSQQTAEFFSAVDLPTAQAGIAAVDDAMNKADAIARRIGMTPPSQCGSPRALLRGAQKVAVEAYDFEFAVAAVAPGATRFVVRNAGDERHHLFVVRLRESGTLDEAVRADRDGEAPGSYLSGAGKVSPVARSGERTSVDIKLRSGSYGLLCFVASPDGTPHAYKGMAAEIFVP